MYQSTQQSQFNRTSLAATKHRIIDTAQYERTVGQRVLDQSRYDTIAAYTKENNRLLASNISDERVDTLRKLKNLQHSNAELQSIHDQQAKQKRLHEQQKLYEQNELLVNSISELKQQQLSDQTTRKTIIDRNQELIQLKLQLKNAEVNMIRCTQIAERELHYQQHRENELRMDAEIERDRQLAIQLEQQYQHQAALDSKLNKQIIQSQIDDKIKLQQEQYDIFLHEKQLVDDIVDSIAREDKLKQQKAQQQRHELQRSIAEYLHERSAWRAAERARLQSEMYEIEQYQLMQQQRQNTLLQQKKDKFAAHDAVLEQLTADIIAKRKEAEYHQSLLDELYREEMEQKQLNEIRERENKLVQQQIDMYNANQQQRQYKQQHEQQLLAEEQLFRQQMLDKFNSDTRIEQMNSERRRREMIEYKKQVESLINDKRVAKQQQIDLDAVERGREAEKNAKELKVVEAERERLLSEYAVKLQQHLPKGVFKNVDEYTKITGKLLNQSAIDNMPVVRSSNARSSGI